MKSLLSSDNQYEQPDYSAALFQDQDDADEEEPSFGPQWLRSLGASLINDETPLTAEEAGALAETPAFSAPSTPPIETPPMIKAQAEPEPASLQEASPAWQTETAGIEANSKASFEDWINQAAEKLSQPDQNVMTTLEALESDLRSRGFVTLEPGTLSVLAQEEEPEPAPLSTPPTPAVPVEGAEPLWAATVNSAAQTPTQPAVPPPMPAFTASAPAAPEPAISAPLMGSPDLLLDAELETTMKRPAIHLQPTSQRPSGHPSSALRRHAGERAAPRQATAGNLSNKERLLKGYQFQLAGSYDEAMQEYRVVIRNAPELLGEVISNMRALLKIAPKYGAGYRVLGDAYMRQGEYLQAMEAYNKALNMTRRAK